MVLNFSSIKNCVFLKLFFSPNEYTNVYVYKHFNSQWLAAGQWLSQGTPVFLSSTNKTDHHDTTEILLRVTLITITLTSNPISLQESG